MFSKKSVKKTKMDMAFCGAILIVLSGFFLPLVIAFITTLSEHPNHFFKQVLFSNYSLAVICCCFASLGIMWLSIPAYRFFTHLIKSKGVMPKSDETCLEAKACAREPEIAA